MRFIVLVWEDGRWNAYGVYRSFMTASRDAQAQRKAIVLPLHPKM